jgi:Transcriptional regulators
MQEIDISEVAKELSELLPTFHKNFIRPFEHQAKNFMSPLLVHTIMILSKSEMLSMTELSNKMQVSKQQMTSIVDKLIENKFVYREHDEADRRSIKIGLTSSGLDFCHNIHKRIINDIKSKLEHLNKDDLLSLHNALNDIYKIFHKIP